MDMSSEMLAHGDAKWSWRHLLSCSYLTYLIGLSNVRHQVLTQDYTSFLGKEAINYQYSYSRAKTLAAVFDSRA